MEDRSDWKEPIRLFFFSEVRIVCLFCVMFALKVRHITKYYLFLAFEDNYHLINMFHHSPFRKILSLWPWSCVVRPEGHAKILFPYSFPSPPVRNEFHILNPAAQLDGGGDHQFHQMANLIHIGGSKNDWRLCCAFSLADTDGGSSLPLLIASEFSEAGREECQGPHSVVFFRGQSPLGSLMLAGFLFSASFPVDLFNLNT